MIYNKGERNVMFMKLFLVEDATIYMILLQKLLENDFQITLSKNIADAKKIIEDEELVLAASKRQLVKIQHHQEKVRIRQEGKEEGLKEGELLKAKENTLMLFKSKYPQEDILILENLTLSQYNEIFKALIENKNLQIIKEMIK